MSSFTKQFYEKRIKDNSLHERKGIINDKKSCPRAIKLFLAQTDSNLSGMPGRIWRLLI